MLCFWSCGWHRGIFVIYSFWWWCVEVAGCLIRVKYQREIYLPCCVCIAKYKSTPTSVFYSLRHTIKHRPKLTNIRLTIMTKQSWTSYTRVCYKKTKSGRTKLRMCKASSAFLRSKGSKGLRKWLGSEPILRWVTVPENKIPGRV